MRILTRHTKEHQNNYRTQRSTILPKGRKKGWERCQTGKQPAIVQCLVSVANYHSLGGARRTFSNACLTHSCTNSSKFTWKNNANPRLLERRAHLMIFSVNKASQTTHWREAQHSPSQRPWYPFLCVSVYDNHVLTLYKRYIRTVFSIQHSPHTITQPQRQWSTPLTAWWEICNTCSELTE